MEHFIWSNTIKEFDWTNEYLTWQIGKSAALSLPRSPCKEILGWFKVLLCSSLGNFSNNCKIFLSSHRWQKEEGTGKGNKWEQSIQVWNIYVWRYTKKPITFYANTIIKTNLENYLVLYLYIIYIIYLQTTKITLNHSTTQPCVYVCGVYMWCVWWGTGSLLSGTACARLDKSLVILLCPLLLFFF